MRGFGVVNSLIGFEVLLYRCLDMNRLDLGPNFSLQFTRTEVPSKRAQTAEFVSCELDRDQLAVLPRQCLCWYQRDNSLWLWCHSLAERHEVGTGQTSARRLLGKSSQADETPPGPGRQRFRSGSGKLGPADHGAQPGSPSCLGMSLQSYKDSGGSASEQAQVVIPDLASWMNSFVSGWFPAIGVLTLPN